MGVKERLSRAFIESIALGDALGATTEFLSVADAVRSVNQHRDDGYPWTPIGGGWLRLPAGAVTDDTQMTMALMAALHKSGNAFAPAALAREWSAWVKSNPPDVGSTIRQIVGSRDFIGDPFGVSERFFRSHPDRAANGALMRNAIVCALAPDLATAYAWSLKQGVLTHYHPLSVLCCAVQVWLIWETFEERWPYDEHDDWLKQWHEEWVEWVLRTNDDDIATWLKHVQEDGALDRAMRTLCDADFDPDSFDPFADELTASQGYVLTTLQIGVWAMHWARRSVDDYAITVKPILDPVAWVLEKRGHHVIGWIPLIGRDADTYGAVAGPMIASAVGTPFPRAMTQTLRCE